MNFENLPTPLKVGVIAGGGLALYMSRYLIGHVFNLMLLLVVLAGIWAVVSKAREAKKQTEQRHPMAVLPPYIPQEDPLNIHTQQRHTQPHER